jgi:hypothetical protein
MEAEALSSDYDGRNRMRTIDAKIIDPTHLELSQPLDALPGEVIKISLASAGDVEMALWREASKKHLLDAYADEDAVYDEL